MKIRFVIGCIAAGLGPFAAQAETELSLYTGTQTAPPSNITVRGDSVIPDAMFEQLWEGQSHLWPIYGGFRVTFWQDQNFGYGLDYAHNKTRPPNAALPAGYDALEFTDGLNTWTINAYWRWPDAVFGQATPYVGAGAGLSVPGVEVRYGASDTFEYQVTGLAATWLAGVSYPIAESWSLFGEYKGTYTSNEVDLVTGGTLSSDIFTDAVNIGISYRF